MSTAWMAPVTLVTEPKRVSALRVAARSAVAVLAILATVFAPAVWVGVLTGLVAVVALLLAALAIANLVRSKGVLLRLMGTGSIERPASIQQGWLKAPVEWVDGTSITVIPEVISLAGSGGDPRITLKGATRTIYRLPLHGRAVADFVADANRLAATRGVTFALGEHEPGAE